MDEKEGWLYKKNTKGLMNTHSWARRFFVLDEVTHAGESKFMLL